MRSCTALCVAMLAVLAAGKAAAEIQFNGSTHDMSEQANIQAVRDIYAGFASGDMNAILANMDETIVWQHPGSGEGIPFAGTFEGKAGVLRFFELAMQSIDVLDQRVLELISDAGRVVVLGYEHMRVKSTGQEYRSNWVHLYTFRNGKIVQFEEFIDTAALRRAFLPGQ